MNTNAPVVAVTVLEDRASVTRRGSVHLAAGQHRLVIEGVSPAIADKTLSATASGARLLDVRCERYLAPWREGAGREATPLAALHAERVRLTSEREHAEAAAAVARSEIDGLRQVIRAAHKDLAIAATRGTQPEGAAPLLAELDDADREARRRLVDADLEAQRIVAELARLESRIKTAEAEAGDLSARLVIDVLAEAAVDVTLSISYVVPGAAWRPYHRAVLARAAGRVDWTTTACVWQATGEDWTEVELTCSLERPSLGVEPPELTDDELYARRRPETVTVEAREQDVQTTGLGAGPLQVPGIDDGGLGLTLSAPRTTVKSDGLPHRVPVGGFTAPAQLSLVAIPLRSPWVHLRARIVNVSQAPLLAGPVDLVMSSGYVGRAEIGFVAPGEKFYLGFGPESELRVHRTETRERDEAGLLGGWNVQTVRVAVRVSNLGTERRQIDVTERIPISEVEQVDVQVSSPDAYLLGTDEQPGGEEITQVTARALDDRGLVTWGVELPPLGRRAVTLEYKVRSQRGVAGV
ncbi:MAG: mucoidy inhibitor MuiA family protein [Myxococcales bacterium]|nr:mucoidy inhibitor MuiA family protein [Myxococcales bacterium]